MELIEKLQNETKELKAAFLENTKEWAKAEYVRLQDFANDFETNYNVNNERKYYSLPNCVTSKKGTAEMFIDIQIKKASTHYTNSIEKLALRIEKKGLDLNKIKLSTTYLDPNISTIITDGKKTISAYTIIASGMIQKPHYRYLIK
jgi:hypothetical protein